jgi:hypothetical protein
MSKRDEPVSYCPFCNAAISPRAATCGYCKASRYGRRRMTPRGFTVFFAIWTSTTLLLGLLSLYIALVPWLPYGETPGYALTITGARAAEPTQRGGCTVEVLDAQGRTTRVTSAACSDVNASQVAAGGPAPAATPPAAADPDRLLAAKVLHTLLTLACAGLLSWLWLRTLRRLFQRSGQPGWVRRAAF